MNWTKKKKRPGNLKKKKKINKKITKLKHKEEKKRERKNTQHQNAVGKTNQILYINATGVQEEERENWGKTNIWRENDQNFWKFMKHINLQIQV